MKRIFFVLCLFIVSLTSCSACTDTVNPPCNGTSCSTSSVTDTSSLVVDASVSNIFSGDTWEVTIPNEWSVKDPKNKVEGLELLFLNEETQSVILLLKEKSSSSLDEYALESLRGLKDVGATLNVAKQVKINDKDFILLDSTRHEITAWTWVTVYGGFGYTFSCSGLSVIQSQEDTCQKIVDTLKIK